MKKHKNIRLFLALFSIFNLAGLAHAHDGHHHGSHGGHDSKSTQHDEEADSSEKASNLETQLEIKASSNFGVDIILSFAEEPSKETDHAKVCFAEGMTLVSALLWMPAHGHGSVPVTINPIPDLPGCALIENIYFLMAGVWEIHLQFADGDEGVFHVAI